MSPIATLASVGFNGGAFDPARDTAKEISIPFPTADELYIAVRSHDPSCRCEVLSLALQEQALLQRLCYACLAPARKPAPAGPIPCLCLLLCVCALCHSPRSQQLDYNSSRPGHSGSVNAVWRAAGWAWHRPQRVPCHAEESRRFQRG